SDSPALGGHDVISLDKGTACRPRWEESERSGEVPEEARDGSFRESPRRRDVSSRTTAAREIRWRTLDPPDIAATPSGRCARREPSSRARSRPGNPAVASRAFTPPDPTIRRRCDESMSVPKHSGYGRPALRAATAFRLQDLAATARGGSGRWSSG